MSAILIAVAGALAQIFVIIFGAGIGVIGSKRDRTGVGVVLLLALTCALIASSLLFAAGTMWGATP